MERKLFLESSDRGPPIWSHKKLVDTSTYVDLQLYFESTAVRSTGLTLILNHLWSDNITIDSMLLLYIILASPKRSKTKLWGSFKRP